MFKRSKNIEVATGNTNSMMKNISRHFALAGFKLGVSQTTFCQRSVPSNI